jgi:hypothetical protein
MGQFENWDSPIIAIVRHPAKFQIADCGLDIQWILRARTSQMKTNKKITGET